MEAFTAQWIDPDTVPEDGTYWFRARGEVQTRSYDPYDERFFNITPRITVRMDAFEVLRTTPKGVWLDVPTAWHADERRRFVRREARKRWACPTRAEAIESLRARNSRRRTILSNQLKHAELLGKYLEDRT